MRDPAAQIDAWKNSDASKGESSDNPAGEVRLPMSRGAVTRAMALAGLVVGIGMIADAANGMAVGTTTGP
jgi:hypothetical protein